MTDDTVTVTITGEDDEDELTVPTALVEMLRENDESAPKVIGDIAMFGFAQRIHGAAHHSDGGTSDHVEGVNEATMDLFEERFGASFGELTGHDH